MKSAPNKWCTLARGPNRHWCDRRSTAASCFAKNMQNRQLAAERKPRRRSMVSGSSFVAENDRLDPSSLVIIFVGSRAGTPRSLIKQRRAFSCKSETQCGWKRLLMILISFATIPKTRTPPEASQPYLSSNGNTSGGVAERLSLFALSIQPHIPRYNSSPQGQVSCPKQNVF